MQFTTFDIAGPVLITPARHGDARGWFMEAFRDDWFRAHVADERFVQDNQSLSAETGTIRGLHYQSAPYGQGKLVRVLKGRIFDVAVDIRLQSPTFGQWIGVELSADNFRQLWVPDGFAHGFCTLEPGCEVFYKTTNPYSRDHDFGVAYDDPDIGIEWPVDLARAVLSDKDKRQPSLASLKA